MKNHLKEHLDKKPAQQKEHISEILENEMMEYLRKKGFKDNQEDLKVIIRTRVGTYKRKNGEVWFVLDPKSENKIHLVGIIPLSGKILRRLDP